MTRNLKMLRFRVVFTGLFLLLNKVCFANTAEFKITPFYRSYYGFNEDYTDQFDTESDAIFYRINGGVSVLCNATTYNSDGTTTILLVKWVEKIGDRYEPLSDRLDRETNSGIYNLQNKTLLITKDLCDAELEGRQFACVAQENGYDQYSTAQTIKLTHISDYGTWKEPDRARPEGGDLYMTCIRPVAAPSPRISFYHNGSLVSPDSRRVVIDGGVRLKIDPVVQSDAGLYQCEAGNPAGVVRSEPSRLKVLPQSLELYVEEKPKNSTLDAGSSLTMRCQFNRSPDDKGWMFKLPSGRAAYETVNSKLARGHWKYVNGGDLLIKMVDRNDSGWYTCFGSDNDDQTSARATVTVIYFDASRASGPKEETVLLGSTTMLSCTVPMSNPPAELSWLRESASGETVLVTAGPGYKVSQPLSDEEEPLYTLTIENVTMRDAGTYRCSAQNPSMVDKSGGFWKSDPATITVRETGLEPSQFIISEKALAVVGQTVTLSCSVQADPEPEVTWFKATRKEGVWKPVVPIEGSRYSFTSSEDDHHRFNFTMQVGGVSLADHGSRYYCALSNRLGTVNSGEMTIVVNHITCRENKFVQDKTFNVQEPATIACPNADSSHPKATTRWVYDTTTSSMDVQDKGVSLYTDSLTDADGGAYVCISSNIMGNCSYTINLLTQDPRAVTSGGNRLLLILMVALAFLVLIIIGFIIAMQMRKRTKKKKLQSTEALERLNQPVFSTSNGYEDGPSQLPSPSTNMTHNQLYSTLSKFGSWQIAKSRLRNPTLLGEGQFGSVYKAELRSLDGSPSFYVAIKQIKDDNNLDAVRDYEKEMLMMTQLNHPNIVKLIGLCTDSAPFYILTEFMEKGNLAEYLQQLVQCKTDRLTLSDQIRIAQQIASGLNYMAEKEFVHRDVAARNCLVGRDLVVKVADFGLSRSVHGREIYHKDGGTVPIRWMSPEAIQYGHYTTANDVWAFGVTMWEVFAYGVIPYNAWSNEDVAANVQSGCRLIKPDCCPQTIYNIMLNCWSEHPDHRPSFLFILESLNAL